MKTHLEKSSTYGAIVAAVACPVCFPKLALLGSLLGLGGLAAYEKYFLLAVQVFIVLTLIVHCLAYRRHRNRRLLTTAVILGGGFFVALYLIGNEWLLYAIFAGHLFTSYWLVRENKKIATCVQDTNAKACSQE